MLTSSGIRIQNPDKKEYTWTIFSKRFIPVKDRQEARLDMVFMSTTVLAYVEKFEHKKLIESTENMKIDHKACIITIDYLNFKPGKGNFRVPQSTIEKEDYADIMVTSMR